MNGTLLPRVTRTSCLVAMRPFATRLTPEQERAIARLRFMLAAWQDWYTPNPDFMLPPMHTGFTTIVVDRHITVGMLWSGEEWRWCQSSGVIKYALDPHTTVNIRKFNARATSGATGRHVPMKVWTYEVFHAEPACRISAVWCEAGLIPPITTTLPAIATNGGDKELAYGALADIEALALEAHACDLLADNNNLPFL